MKLSFVILGIFGLFCLTDSKPHMKISNAVIEEQLNELEILLKQRTNNGNTRSLHEQEERRIAEKEEEEEREEQEMEENIKKADREAELREFIDEEKSKMKGASKKWLKLENKRKMDKKTTTEEEDEEEEEVTIDEDGEIDPDSPQAKLMEGEIIEVNGIGHKVPGLHPELNSKTFGDSNDFHKLTNIQIQQLAKGHGRQRRNFITNTNQLWQDSIVPYTIYNMSTSAIIVINSAIQEFTDKTCVRWVPESQRGSYNLNHNNNIYFINEAGCWSYVGNVDPQNNNKQPLSLQEMGCVTIVTAVHEMLHAMGGHHEQSRSDRDQYVQIEWNNVNGGTGNYNMQRLSTQDNNPYDAESSMQYALYSFSTNGQKTILFKDQRLAFLADIAVGLEFYDVQDVTDAYHCADHCTNPPACQNGGFVNFQCVCVCPDGLTGATCTDTVSNSNTCGGVINVGAGETRYIESPNYPNNYPTGLECTWLIKGTSTSLVRASVESMDIATGNACYHWLEYRYNLLGQTGPKRCGTNFNAGQEIWDSTPDEIGSAMMIKFNSNMNSNQAATKGFQLKLELIGTGCVNNPCLYGTCSSPSASDSYTCTCQAGVTGVNCETLDSAATIGCTFEYGETCFLANEVNDQFDWADTNAETPSSGTGPSAAHGGFQYTYAEASSPRVQGDRAVLASKVQFNGASARCLSFYYHMYGSAMGTLNVYTEGSNTAKSTVFTRTGDQGNQWVKEEIDIPAIVGLKVSFESVRGFSWPGDMGLDDVVLAAGTCSQTTPQTTSPPPTTPQPTTPQPTTPQPTTPQPTTTTILVTPQPTTPAPTTTLQPTTPQPTTPQPTTPQPTTPLPTIGIVQQCTFEQGASCFMTDSTDDDFDWTTRSGSTPSSGTGPSTAYKGNQYKYIEVSSPRSNGDEATLVSSSAFTGDFCLSFAYHMYGGTTMGDLVVETGVTSPQTEIFRQSGNQGDQWNDALIDITVQNEKLFITGTRGSTWKGDVAIDELQLHSGSCNTIVTVAPTTQQPTTQSPTIQPPTIGSDQQCTFEQGTSCFMVDSTADDFDWTTRSGSTLSSGTGPTGAYEGSQYKYIEVSSPTSNGDEATLVSSSVLTGDYCLSFFYHMYGGTTMGDLVVETGVTSPQTEIFRETGDHGNQWNDALVDITAQNEKLFITGSRGTTWKGDIAIDNLQLTIGSCTTNPCSRTPCANGGTCTEDTTTNVGYTCSCLTGFTGADCTIIDYGGVDRLTCDFEDGETGCPFTNSIMDDFDWSTRSGGTPSSSTGPDGAYTGNQYIYTEVSSPVSNNDVAILTTDTAKLRSATPYCLHFAYHMKGSPGDLVISAHDRGSITTDVVYQLSGHQGDDWIIDFADIPAFSDPVINIEGSRGSSYKGDIAIDDLVLEVGTCPV